MDETDRVCRDLGLRVLELRKQRRWTQEQLAERVDIDPRDLRRIERGDNITVRMLVRLAAALEVTVPELFTPPRRRYRRRPGRPRASG